MYSHTACSPKMIIITVHTANSQRTFRQRGLQRLHALGIDVLLETVILLENILEESPCRSAVVGAVSTLQRKRTHLHRCDLRVDPRRHDLRHGRRTAS